MGRPRSGRGRVFRHRDRRRTRTCVRRRAAPRVQRDGLRVQTDVGAQTIGVGDHIETRRNDRRLSYGPEQAVHNHDRWRVVAVDQTRGTLEVEHLRHQARVTLPADYVARYVRLAYATTIAAAQGLTVDETYVVVTPGMYRRELYTALSRGRDKNHAYAICDTDTDTDLARSQVGRPPTPVEVLARVSQRERPDWAAHDVLRRSMTHAEHPDVIRSRMVEVVRAMERTPDGPDRDALTAYGQQLASSGRAIERAPTRATRTPAPALERSLVPDLTIEL